MHHSDLFLAFLHLVITGAARGWLRYGHSKLARVCAY